MMDYYEFLQISPNADYDTIHRVYRFLAARFHPDNQKSGSKGMFEQLKIAYDVLSDPERRAKYDTTRNQEPRPPLSSTIDFMDSLEGELNRRLAVLALLYYRRRTSPNIPEVSLADIEERMGFPRDYLDFTLWYLQKKGYIARADNAQYALTADGVDFVESERAKVPTLNLLLTSTSESSADAVMQSNVVTETYTLDKGSMPQEPATKDGETIILPATMEDYQDRRTGKKDRRVGAPDLRIFKVERRGYIKDRRSAPNGRQNSN